MRQPLAKFLFLAAALGGGGALHAPYSNIAQAAADEPAAREYAVKAAFIYNFAQFTQWPADAFPAPDSPLVIGVIGDSPIEAALRHAVAGKLVAGHTLVIRHLGAPIEVPQCRLLVVPASEQARLGEIFKQVADGPILSVGESDFFLWSGGTIRFLTEENKVRFEINPESAERARLRISSKLMKLAKIFKRS